MNENIIELQLKYKNSAGDTRYYTFDKETSYNTLVTIPDVSRIRQTQFMCFGEGSWRIVGYYRVRPVHDKPEEKYSAGFVNAIHRRYGYHTDTKEDEERFEEFVENAQSWSLIMIWKL